MRRKLIFSLTGLCLLLLLLIPILAQQNRESVSAIEKLIDAGNYKAADSLVIENIDHFIAIGNIDTLVSYIPLKAKISDGLSTGQKTGDIVFSFITLIKEKKNSPSLLMNAYREAADYFANTGKNQQGYRASEEALIYSTQMPGKNEVEIARSEYNLGTFAHRLGNVSLAQDHHRKALAIREMINANPEDIYLSCNAMGSMFWYASKYDSATILFTKALEALKKMPGTDLNKYYRPGNVLNNMAALYSATGKTSEAIATMKETIDDFKKFIEPKDPHPKKKDATKALFEAIDNLAGIYREIGDYGKAGDLLRYSYQQKQAKLNPGEPGIFISEILLGQHYNAIREYDIALDFLTRGLTKLEKAEGDYLFWAADAYYALAQVYENKKNDSKAAECYEKSESLYDESYQGDYDNIYMDFLRNAAMFYATNGQYSKALAKANKVYSYLEKVGQDRSLQAFYQLLNIADVNYLAKKYEQAAEYSQRAISLVNERIGDGSTVLDSVKIEVFKPRAVLVHARADYQLQPKQDTVYLNRLSLQLKDALQILEKRKVLLDDAESINILIADNAELIDFAKKIELELYQLTGSAANLDQFINLHESGLYNRIRSRLDKQQAIRFSNLPDSIQAEEQQLKAAIASSLQDNKSNKELIDDYLLAVKKWELHLDKVKNLYPDYYGMRYASIFKSLPQLQSAIPSNTTVLRYFFVDTSLFALVADHSNKKLIPLNSAGISDKITFLLNNTANDKIPSELLRDLYVALWKPLAPDIKTKKVLIIPDGILYGLSFDLLTPGLVQSYSDLATKSVMTDHTISYHYSLFMLGNNKTTGATAGNYVAFAPGFSDEIKKEYVAAVKDSINLDHQYLALLPQPNTNKLVKKIQQMVGGNTFLDNASTQGSFKKNAGGHKIIHIGTHAEYNNINPERSRLIFAKNGETDENNYLYLQDIYNCDISSDLTVLTACESGKPGYKDGEGMISLAHAFNYAGSNTILTGLWKIDEQSNSMITDYFFQNLAKSLPADEALRQAKLRYLANAKGRMLAPAYWAGLVMMGDASTITLEAQSNSWWPWALGSSMLVVVLIIVMRRRQLKSQ